MPNLTTNLGLKKPLLTEAVDINILNQNMDILDGKVINASNLNGKIDALTRMCLYPETMTTAEKTVFQNDATLSDYYLKSEFWQDAKAFPKRTATASYNEEITKNTTATKTISINSAGSNYIKIIFSRPYNVPTTIFCRKINGVWDFEMYGLSIMFERYDFVCYQDKWKPEDGKCTYYVHYSKTHNGVNTTAYGCSRGIYPFSKKYYMLDNNGRQVFQTVLLNLPQISNNSLDLIFVPYCSDDYHGYLETTVTVEVF